MKLFNLPWWGWIVGAFVSVLLGLFSDWLAERKEAGCINALAVIVFYLSAFVMGLIGVIRLVKWVWTV